MAYKTLMLQIYRPTSRKRLLMDNALESYSRALEFLTERYKGKVIELADSKEKITKTKLLNIVDKDTARELNMFNVQPFKDSLIMEFASLSAAYIAQKRRSSEAGYPSPFVDDAEYSRSISGLVNDYDRGSINKKKFWSSCARLIDKANRAHPIYFGRYAMTRDYCLLYDRFKNRFYAKLYLMNFSQAITRLQAANGLSLRYVAPGMPPVYCGAGKRRYIVVPLAFGKKQYGDLQKALKNPALLRTARLLKRQNKYYLMVNMECGGVKPSAISTNMGVARAVAGGLFYTICDLKGGFIASGRLLAPPGNDRQEFVFANEIVNTARQYASQVILETDGGRNDRMPKTDASMSENQYAAMARALQYKLPETGLPAPVDVSANSLFSTCPQCGGRTRKNRLTDEIFACVKCGYAAGTELVASQNLAKRLIKYRRDRVPIYVEKTLDGIRFYNKTLGFESVVGNESMDSRMYYELNLFVQGSGSDFESDVKKYALLKKLRQSPSIKEAVRIVPKNE